jgi:imidazolonepropionase-like amidohydrolase
MVDLLGRLHKAGVPIVAGTDGAGIELVHELEIYVQAGFTPAEAVAAATLVPARLVGQERKAGRSRSARPPISCLSTAIRPRRSGTSARRGW